MVIPCEMQTNSWWAFWKIQDLPYKKGERESSVIEMKTPNGFKIGLVIWNRKTLSIIVDSKG